MTTFDMEALSALLLHFAFCEPEGRISHGTKRNKWTLAIIHVNGIDDRKLTWWPVFKECAEGAPNGILQINFLMLN